MTFTAVDQEFMGQAMALAEKAANLTSPNPAVGCVIVLNNKVVGLAHTQPAGGLHAEAMALSQCKESPAGGTA